MSIKSSIFRGVLSALIGCSIASGIIMITGADDFWVLGILSIALTATILYRSYTWFPVGKKMKLNLNEFNWNRR